MDAPARTLVMGVLNVTPDSFSDGGLHFDPQAAFARAEQMVAEGADIIDIGGESTRPGSERPAQAEELRRTEQVVRAVARLGVPVSIDTMRASVAQACVAAGATLINDVSGGLADPQMLPAVAELGVDYVCMHWRAHGHEMNAYAVYHDVVTQVHDELLARRDAALAAGIAGERIILDPGYGFAKNAEQNWQLLAAQPAMIGWGHRVLVAVSRKRFLGALLADGEDPRPAIERDAATVALSTLAAEQGAWAVRTHQVRDNRDAVEVVARVSRAGATLPRRR